MRASTAFHLLCVSSLAAFAMACGGSSPEGLAGTDAGAAPPGTSGPEVVATPDVDGGTDDDSCKKMDFIFVVDDSGSMAEEQRNLGSNFPRFVEAIEAYRTKSGDPLDYRLAVTTTGITHTIEIPPPVGFPFPIPAQTIAERGADGAFQMKSACGMTRRWLQRGDANVAANFACIAKVGTSGPAFEMPLEGMKRALVDRVSDNTNAGFLREDALLAVVFLTDEDDCSTPRAAFTANDDSCVPPPPGLVSIATYMGVLDTVKGGGSAGRSRWASAVIAGERDCDSAFGSARTATRMAQFVTQSGPNAVFSSICSGDLAGGLTAALNGFKAACQNFQPPR